MACDDGNLIDTDGCDQNCTIETDYVCMNGTTTTPSICSYNGSISSTVDSSFKDPNSNSMSIVYMITPFSPLIAVNGGSTDFTSMISFPGSEDKIIMKPAIIDPSTGKLTVNFDYTETIQDSELKMQITPPDVPQS